MNLVDNDIVLLIGILDPNQPFLTTQMVSKSRLKQTLEILKPQLQTKGLEVCVDENSAYLDT